MNKSIFTLILMLIVSISQAQRSTTTNYSKEGPVIDGVLDESIWNINNELTNKIQLDTNTCGISNQGSGINNTAYFGSLWNEKYLYIGVKVLDNVLTTDDAVDIFLNLDNIRSSNCPVNWPRAYSQNDYHLIYSYGVGFSSPQGIEVAVSEYKKQDIPGGFAIEIKLSWAELDFFSGLIANTGRKIGFDIANSDSDSLGQKRTGQLMWNQCCSNRNWTENINFGYINLGEQITLNDTAVVICEGQTFNFESINGVNKKWYDAAGRNTTPSTPGVGSHFYYFTQTKNGVESAKATLKLTVNAKPASPSVSYNNSQLNSQINRCVNENTNLSASGTSIKWYGKDNNLLQNGSNYTFEKLSSTNTTSVFVTHTNTSNCESNKTEVVINTNKPADPGTTNIVACQNENINFNGSVSGTNIKWYTSQVATTSFTPTTANSGSFSYYVTQTVNSCEGARVPISVAIKTRPANPSLSSSSFSRCLGSSIEITASGENIKWFNESQANLGSGITYLLVSSNTIGTKTYYVSQTKDNCESNKLAFTVEEKNVPDAPTIGSQEYCKGTAANGQGYNWYTSVGAKLSAPSTDASASYSVSQVSNGCESAKTTVAVTVKETAAKPTETSFSFCSDAIDGKGYNWYTSSNGGISTTKSTITGTYFISKSESGKCESARQSVNVTIYAKPAAPSLKSATISYCQYSKANEVTTSVNGTGSFNWYNNSTGSTKPASLLPSTALPVNKDYFVSQNSSEGCESDRSKLQIIVNATPVLKVTDLTLSRSGSVNITTTYTDSNNTQGAVTYWKNIGATESLSETEAKSISIGGIYYIKKVTVAGCADIKSVNVKDPGKKSQSITFSSIPVKTYGDVSFELAATSSATNLLVDFSSSDTNVASIKGNIVTIKKAGNSTITASQKGNAEFNPASDIQRVLTINKAPQKIIISSPITDKSLGDPAFEIVAKALPSNQNCSFGIISGPAAIVNNKITISETTTGEIRVMIFHAGVDDFYLPKDTTIAFNVRSATVISTDLQPVTEDGKSIASIKLRNDLVNRKVSFFYKKITSENWESKILESAGNTFTHSFDNNMDEVGVRYYFKIEYGASNIELTDISVAHREYPSGLNLPGITGGTKLGNYKIIAIPLELKLNNVSDVFKNVKEFNKYQFRLFHFENQQYKELTESDPLVPGKGYWVISRNDIAINTGAGSAVKVTEDSPYLLKLKQGWNQIGNPYNFPISWESILRYNNSPIGLDNEVSIYLNNGWETTAVLDPFNGGFVFSEEEREIKIPPVKYVKSNNLRIEDDGWVLNFSLKDENEMKARGGIGMMSGAALGKDSKDKLTPPRFLDYVEFNIDHPEYSHSKFSYDIVPFKNEHLWEVQIESNTNSGFYTLAWDSRIGNVLEKQIYLYDPETAMLLDMKKKTSYRTSITSAKKLLIYYGDERNLNSSLGIRESKLLSCYPNPVSTNSIVAFSLSSGSSHEVIISLYNSTMQEIKVIDQGVKSAGIYNVAWEALEPNGKKLSSGLYFIKLKVTSNGKTQEWLQKIILQ